MRRHALLAAALIAPACGGRLVQSDAPARGNVHVLAAEASASASHATAPDPLVILAERRGVRAVDPLTGEVRWWIPARTSGHIVAGPTSVYVPVEGHRVISVDRATGTVNWQVALPGEALTGLAVSEPFLVAAVIDHRRGRSRLVALSTRDGGIRWMRRSEDRFGVPAAVGRVAFAPIGDQVAAFGLWTGHEKGRIDVSHSMRRGVDRPAGAPAYERVSIIDGSLVAGQRTRWVDLRAAIEAKVEGELTRVDGGYGAVFSHHEGLDPGFDDAERQRLWVDFDRAGAPPRSAVLMCRRAVVAVRLDPSGRATEAQWAYLGDEREFVAMDVGEHRVTLVREDGAILQLSRRAGLELERIRGGEPTAGALVLDADRPVPPTKRQRPLREATLRELAEIVLDRDPRLLPAQRLVADLMWRDGDPRVREAVVELTNGVVRSEPTDAAEALRRHALDLLQHGWGRPDETEDAELLAELATRPSFLDGTQPGVNVMARQVVEAGEAAMIPHLVDHLMHPGTPAAMLSEIVDALGDLEHPAAVEGLARFLRRYHADPGVVGESNAVLRTVDALIERQDPRRAHGELRARLRDVASAVLDEVVHDPFTEPTLRDYIARRVQNTSAK